MIMVIDASVLADAGFAVGMVGAISFGVALVRSLWKRYLMDALGGGSGSRPFRTMGIDYDDEHF